MERPARQDGARHRRGHDDSHGGVHVDWHRDTRHADKDEEEHVDKHGRRNADLHGDIRRHGCRHGDWHNRY